MTTYQPTLESVQTHPLPQWYDDAKFGIFIHWGLYSVPAFAPKGEINIEKLLKGEVTNAETPYAEWYQNSLRIEGSSVHKHHLETYGADFSYAHFAPQFNEQIQAWDPDAWADLFAQAGAKYVVLVTKHHDGYLMWDSRYPNPRVPNWQVSRDVAGDLTHAVSARGMRMGFYYSSLLDWSFTKRPIVNIVDLVAGSDVSKTYVDYVERHWLELIERYDPWILWSDIGYPPGYKLPRLFAHFYNRQPEGVVNDRWMQLPKIMFNRVSRFILAQVMKHMDMGGTPNVPHSDFVTPEYATLAHIASHKWETCRGIGNSFGYNQLEDAQDYQKAPALIRLLADIVSKNGNLLLNVGPRADGSLHPAQTEALEGLGAWLKVNGEAIYGTCPWQRFKDTSVEGGEVRYTTKGGTLYAIVVHLPETQRLLLPLDTARAVSLLETGERLSFEHTGQTLTIRLPDHIQKGSVPAVKIQG